MLLLARLTWLALFLCFVYLTRGRCSIYVQLCCFLLGLHAFSHSAGVLSWILAVCLFCVRLTTLVSRLVHKLLGWIQLDLLTLDLADRLSHHRFGSLAPPRRPPVWSHGTAGIRRWLRYAVLGPWIFPLYSILLPILCSIYSYVGSERLSMGFFPLQVVAVICS